MYIVGILNTSCMGGACREQLPSLPLLLSVVLFLCPNLSWGQLKLPDVSLKASSYQGKDVFAYLLQQEFVQSNSAFLFSSTSRLGQVTVLLLRVSTAVSDAAK